MVIIKSVIKSNPMGRWYIELSDTTKEESMEMCININDYAKKVEMMGAEYAGGVEVVWSSDDNVTEAQINEVRMQMMVYETEIESQKHKQMEG